MKVKEETPAVATFTRAQLVLCASEINRVLSLEPKEAISLKPAKNGLSDEDLKTAIITWGDQFQAEDFLADDADPEFKPFTEEVTALFEALGIMIPKKPAPIKVDEKGKKVKDAPKPASTNGGVRANRYLLFGDIFKPITEPIMYDALLELLDAKYEELGGKRNAAEAHQTLGRCIQIMEGMGHVTKNKDGLITKVV